MDDPQGTFVSGWEMAKEVLQSIQALKADDINVVRQLDQTINMGDAYIVQYAPPPAQTPSEPPQEAGGAGEGEGPVDPDAQVDQRDL